MTKLKTWAAAAAMLALSGAAQSALINRGGGMIYDTTANITWLADMNYAYTSGYAANGVAPYSTWGENTIWTDGRMGWAALRAAAAAWSARPTACLPAHATQRVRTYPTGTSATHALCRRGLTRDCEARRPGRNRGPCLRICMPPGRNVTPVKCEGRPR